MPPPLLSTWYGLLLLSVVTLAVTTLAHLAANALVARLVGVRILEVSLFMGPRIWSRTYAGIEYSLRGLPLGGFVALHGLEPDGKVEPGSFRALHPLARIAVILSGPLGTLLLSTAILGWESSAHAFLTGFPQILRTSVSPFGYGMQVALNAFQLIAQGELLRFMGVAAGKLAAFNCLPLPSLCGGQALITLLQWRGRWAPNTEVGLRLVGNVTALLVVISLVASLVNGFLNVSFITP